MVFVVHLAFVFASPQQPTEAWAGGMFTEAAFADAYGVSLLKPRSSAPRTVDS
jgi:hypothetical protein